MSSPLFAILFILLALLMLLQIARAKRKFGGFQVLLCLIAIGLLVGGMGLLFEKGWARLLSNISLGAFILCIVLPALGRLLGVAIFSKMFYEGMEEEDKD